MITSCVDGGTNLDSGFHPNFSLLYSAKDKDVVKVGKNKVLEEYYNFNLQELMRINLEDDRYRISRFEDVMILEDKILILDNRINEVHNISFSGEVNKPVAISGRGPGELVEPTNMMRFSGSYFIADRVNGIHYFSDKNDSLLFTKKIEILPEYVCQLDSNRFITKASYLIPDGYTEAANSTVFEVDEVGVVYQEFTPRYKHQSNMLIFNMTNGPMICSDSKGLIINSYSSGIPVVEVYDTNNNTKSIYNFIDINPFLVEYSNNNLSPAAKNYGSIYHNFRSINLLHERYLIVQYREVDRPKDPELEYEYSILSYIIDLNSDETYYTYALPEIFASSDEKMFYRYPSNSNELILSSFELSEK
ncbi:MAG: 6-bladed beta-propeller [Balneolaceae bacterium]